MVAHTTEPLTISRAHVPDVPCQLSGQGRLGWTKRPLLSNLGWEGGRLIVTHSGTIAIDRDLTVKERSLVERLLHSGVVDISTFLPQLLHLRVVSRCSCGCPTIDFAISGRTADLTSASTILGEGGGTSPEGVCFGIILHGREGLISELEVYGLEREGPFTLPDINQIEIYDCSKEH